MAYSEDYRKRVIAYREEGHPFKGTHEVLKIAIDISQNGKKLREDGTLSKKQ